MDRGLSGTGSPERAAAAVLAAEFIMLAAPAFLFAPLAIARVFDLKGSRSRLKRNGEIITHYSLSLCVLAAAQFICQQSDDLIEVPYAGIFVPPEYFTLAAFIPMIAVSVAERYCRLQPSGLITVFVMFTSLYDLAYVKSHRESTQVLILAEKHEICAAILVIKATLVWFEFKRLLEGPDHSPESINNATDSFTFVVQHLITLKSIPSSSTKDDEEIRSRQSQAELLQAAALKAERSNNLARSTRKNAILRVFGLYFVSILPHLMLIPLQFAQYAILSTMLFCLDAGPRQPTNAVYLFPLATLSIFCSTAIVNCYAGFYTRRCASWIRSYLSTALFRKATQRPSFEHDVGELTTFMNYHLVVIEEASQLFPIFSISLVKVAGGVYLTVLGTSVSFGLPAGFLLCCSFAVGAVTLLMNSGRRNAWISRVQIRLSRTMDFFLHSMPLKLPTMDAVAENFAKRVCDARDEEVWSGTKLRNIWFNALCLAFVPIVLVPSLSFVVTYQRFDQPTLYSTLYAVTVFLPPLAGIYQYGAKILVGYMSLARVINFLDAPPHRYFERLPKGTAAETTKQLAFSLENASFGWTDYKITLEKLTVDIPRNKTTVITGDSGSGKSTLCRALAGEIPFSSGTVRSYLLTDKLSYCSQIPLFLEATIRENIIGTLPFKEARYRQALAATQLDVDIANLSLGDSTPMGGFNCNLSVGQRSRIALARALYLDAELVIFDNALNGVDWRMERDIFHTVLGKQGILRKRGTTCIFTTHLRHHLQLSDFVIGLDTNGCIGFQGDLADFIQSAAHRYQSMDMITASTRPKMIKKIHTLSSGRPRLLPNIDWSKVKRSRNFPRTTKKKKDQLDDEKKREEEARIREEEHAKAKAKKNKEGKTKDEENKQASIFDQLGAALEDNDSYFFPLAGLSFFYLLFAHSCGTWFAYWGEDAFEGNRSYFVYYYGYIRSVEIFGLISLCSVTASYVTSVVADVDYAGALKAVFWRGISNYDKNLFRSGMSHLLEDFALMDEQAQVAVMNVGATGATILLGLSTASIARPWAAACYPLPIAVLYLIQVYFSSSMRKLGEAEAESRGSLSLHQYEVLTTLSATRPAGWVEVEYGRNQQLVQNHCRHRLFNFLVQDWIFGRCLVAVGLICAALMAAALHTQDLSGWYLVAIISTLAIIDGLPNLLDAYTTLERVTGGVARLRSLAEVKPTDRRKPRGAMPPFGWPRGSINMSSVFAITKYGSAQARNNQNIQHGPVPVQLSLNNLSLKIEQGEKIALAGRSGSGKSVLVNLLRRVHQPLDICREVQIDGQPLSRLNPEEVCDGIHYLSHEMLFFPGAHTIRDHLDIYGRSTFEECETVLQTVGLNRWLMEKGGSNDLMTPECLSHGERRLFCLARMLLRSKQRRLRGKGNGLIVLDDMEPDLDRQRCETVEKVLKREMTKCTVIMVSNRLDMASRICDRVIIMNDGRAATTGSWEDLCEPEPTFPNIYHQEILAIQRARRVAKGKGIPGERGRDMLSVRQQELGKGRAKDRSISPDNPDTFIEATEPGYQIDPDGVRRQKVIITSTNTQSIWPRKRLKVVPSVSQYERPSNDERSVIRIYPMERGPRFQAHAEYTGAARQVARLMDPSLTAEEGHALLRDMESEHHRALAEYHANNQPSLYYDDDEDDWEDIEDGPFDANDTTDDEEDEEPVVASSSAGPSNGTSSQQTAQQTAQQPFIRQWAAANTRPTEANAPLPYLGEHVYVSAMDLFLAGPRPY